MGDHLAAHCLGIVAVVTLGTNNDDRRFSAVPNPGHRAAAFIRQSIICTWTDAICNRYSYFPEYVGTIHHDETTGLPSFHTIVKL